MTACLSCLPHRRIDKGPLNLFRPELRAGHGHLESTLETELDKSPSALNGGSDNLISIRSVRVEENRGA